MKSLSAIDKCLWDPLIHLFDRPWFRHIWVIQEMAESTKTEVMYGSTPVDWFYIRQTAVWLVHRSGNTDILKKFHTNGVHNAAFTAIRHIQIENTNPVLQFFHIGRRFEASEQVEKVFAMSNHPIEVLHDVFPWNSSRYLVFPLFGVLVYVLFIIINTLRVNNPAFAQKQWVGATCLIIIQATVTTWFDRCFRDHPFQSKQREIQTEQLSRHIAQKPISRDLDWTDHLWSSVVVFSIGTAIVRITFSFESLTLWVKFLAASLFSIVFFWWHFLH
jgi:hypothetical protein